jgi:TPR repeat protein
MSFTEIISVVFRSRAAIFSLLALAIFSGCAKESEKIRQLRLAAEKGDPKAQVQLGLAYDSDSSVFPGISRNTQTAAMWFRRAADQGNADAQCLLGNHYRDGSGVLKDTSEAVKLLRLSADQGNAFGQAFLGSMYANGEGVPKNAAEAFKLFRLAAEQGSAIGQCELGLRYATGEGAQKDEIEGASWLRKAADQGYARAQRNLGAMYFNGVGVPKDISEAKKLIGLAAAQGDADAKRNLVIVNKPQPLEIEAFRLIQEYEANEIRADSAYKGKMALVSGYVGSIGKDILGQPYVALRRDDGRLGQVQCMLNPDAVAEASTLNPGQPVTLIGRIDGKMMNVIVRDCVFSK